MCAAFTAQAQTDAAARKAEKARVAALKKDITQTKLYLKAGNNLDKAETLMRNKLKDSLNMSNIELHQLLQQAVKMQLAQENEKMYLKQKYDTVRFIQQTRNLFLVTQTLDSIDALPNKKGVSAPRYRKDNALLLSQYVNNLYGGTIYYVNHQRWADAITLANLYISLPEWAVFGDNTLTISPGKLHHAAYMVLLSGYRGNDFAAALKHSDLALQYKRRYEASLQYLTSISQANKDTEAYLRYLNEGVEKYPINDFFFAQLIDYHSAHGDFVQALDVTDKVLAEDSLNAVALVARNTILLNLERYDECIALGDRIISLRDTLFTEENAAAIADVYYDVALAYYNQTLEPERTIKNVRQRNKVVNPLYKKCRPYMEEYRRLVPDASDKWRPVLYKIYLNLNLGKEFTELVSLE